MTTAMTTKRIQVGQAIPAAYRGLVAVSTVVEKAAADAGVDKLLIGLVKMRASQLNGCAYCLDMHGTYLVNAGEDLRRIFVLEAWRETDLFNDQERAALELTEAITRLSDAHGLPDELYERATAVFTEDQYSAVVWAIVVINSFNLMSVPGQPDLPDRR